MVSRSRRRLRLGLVVMAAIVLAAAGCARTNQDPVNPANDSGKVTIACGATEEWCAAMAAGFTKSTGLKAEYVRLSSGEALARIQAGKARPEFDVWHGGPADGYVAAAKQDLLDPYVSPNAASIAAKYKDPAGMWTGVYVGAIGFCSNTKVLAEKGLTPPTSWQDLLNPALSRNVAIAHPSTSGTAYTTLWTQTVLNGGIDGGLAYMKKLHSNILQYTKSGAAPGQMVGRGEIAVGVIFSHDCVALQAQGIKDLTVTFPKEGTGYETGGIALLKRAANPITAKKYIDWALTAQAQEIPPTVNSFQLPTNPAAKVSDKAVNLSQVKLIDYDVVAAGAAKATLTKRFDDEIAQAPKA